MAQPFPWAMQVAASLTRFLGCLMVLGLFTDASSLPDEKADFPTEVDTWGGQRSWLKGSGVRSQGWFWVNTHEAWVAAYCSTCKYDLTIPVWVEVKMNSETNGVLATKVVSEYMTPTDFSAIK